MEKLNRSDFAFDFVKKETGVNPTPKFLQRVSIINKEERKKTNTTRKETYIAMQLLIIYCGVDKCFLKVHGLKTWSPNSGTIERAE